MSGKRGQAGRMIKLTHAERAIRRMRNQKRDRKGRVRKKYKLDREVEKVREEIRR
jgi:hypothetical protein